ncbi:MAG: SusC/RagA family TonB-linked outer membrane protein, partial [Segetibacter sp.]
MRVPNASSVLGFSFLGYASTELRATKNGQLNVTLTEALNNLQEVVITGFRKQTKAEQTAAISTIKSSDITKAPVGDVTNAITGRMVGVMTRQPRGRPGASEAQIFIRGRASANSAALIIVDGVERESFGDIDPNDIESISTLKDAASTALFGLKGANGVIVITTKRGKEGKITVSFNSSVGVQTFGQRPKPLRSYQSAMLLNEGQENLLAIGTPNITKVFSPQDIETFRKGDGDPLLYPDVDWFKALTREAWMRTQHNLSFSGGSKKAAFYISLGYMFEDGIFKQFNTPSGYTTSPFAKRTNFRSNLDYNVTKTTKVSLNLAGRIENEYTVRPIASYNDPIGTILSGSEALFNKISTMEPWGAPFNEEYTQRSTPEMIKLDDTYNQIGNVGFPGTGVSESPYISMKRGGYSMQEKNVLESTFILSQDLGMVTKGLNFTGSFAYDQYTTAIRVQYGAGTVYGVNRATKELYNLFGTNPTELQIEDGFNNRAPNTSGKLKTNLQLNLNYTRQFGAHKVSGAVVGTRELEPISGAAPIAFQGLVYRSSYNYKDKYYVEFNGTYQGSENYPKGERYGFFPTVGFGYAITQEKFMQGIKKTIGLDYMKFRGSYGMVGFGNTGGRFLYLDSYGRPAGGGHFTAANGGLGNGYFGNPANIGSSNWDPRPGGAGTRPTGGQNVPVIVHTNIGNPFITWEKSLKRNLGVDANFLQNRIQLVVDVFDETRRDILLSRSASTPVIYGEPVPSTNYGKNYNGGIEVELKLNNRSGAFDYGINMQFSHIKNKRL